MSEYRLAEKPALDALTAMGYAQLSPEAALSMRQEANRALLKPVMIEALQTLNEGLGIDDAEAIYNDLSTLSDNEEWQRRLRGAYSRRLAGEARDRPIALIDFKRPDRNHYHVVSQLKVEAQRSRIPDLVVFVNGIPLVVIEAKSPMKMADRAGQAFEQIKQYERDIPRLFYPNAFNIVTDGMATFYGATGSPSQFYAPWPDPWPRQPSDFDTDEMSEAEQKEAFVRKAAELRRVTRELVDKNPAQYGRFSERVLEIIRKFEEGQIASAEGLKDFEDLTGGINAEKGAHDELGMSERAFAVLRIMEQHAADPDHATLQAAAMAVDAVYADAQRAQPLWFSMEGLRKTLRQTVRRIVVEHDLPEAKAIRDAVEDYAVHAYAAHH